MDKIDKYFIVFFFVTIFILGFGISQIVGTDKVDEFRRGFFSKDINIKEQEIPQNSIGNLNITYINLTENETLQFEEILSKIKEEYLVGNDNWVVTKNMIEYCDTCIGLNIGKGKEIIIKYRDNIETMKRTICHETIHTFMITSNESHEIVYDVANYRTCFYG